MMASGIVHVANGSRTRYCSMGHWIPEAVDVGQWVYFQWSHENLVGPISQNLWLVKPLTGLVPPLKLIRIFPFDVVFNHKSDTHTHIQVRKQTSQKTNKLTNTRPSLEPPQRCAAKIVVVCALTHYKPIADAKSALANGPSGSKWRSWSSVADPISWHGTIFVFYSVSAFGSPNDLKKQGWNNIPQP